MNGGGAVQGVEGPGLRQSARSIGVGLKVQFCHPRSQLGPLRSISSRPEDSFIPDPEVIKRWGKRAPCLSGYFVLGQSDSSGSGTEDCTRARGPHFLVSR